VLNGERASGSMRPRAVPDFVERVEPAQLQRPLHRGNDAVWRALPVEAGLLDRLADHECRNGCHSIAPWPAGAGLRRARRC
jgi:hypothetical protein